MLQSMGLQRVRHDRVTEQQQQFKLGSKNNKTNVCFTKKMFYNLHVSVSQKIK